jgi:hypothetical protein
VAAAAFGCVVIGTWARNIEHKRNIARREFKTISASPCSMEPEVCEPADYGQAATYTKRSRHDITNETDNVTVWTRSDISYIDHEEIISNSRSTHTPDAMCLPATNDHSQTGTIVAQITSFQLTKIYP